MQDKLERRKRAVIEMHCRGALPSQIARHFDVEYISVRAFLDRHADEIKDLQADLNAQLNALWIADKAERVHAYQDVADGARKWIDNHGLTTKTYRYNEDGEPYEFDERFDRNPGESLGKAMRSVSEELGQLPKSDTNTNINVGILIRQVAGYEGEIG